MTDFTLHDKNNAPEQSQELLDGSIAVFGMIPNLHALMAEAPGLLQGYQQLHQLFTETSFDATEQTVVWQTINVEHACHYCVPAHTGIAKQMKVDDEVTEALRSETPLPSEKLEALRDFTLAMVRERGEVDDATVKRFLDAGYTQRQVLEVVLGLAQKVMSNYTNHLARTPIDEPFKRFEWHKQG
ncbi:alkylhydroperoxidase AhpD family core domain-containing protein [Modicisalibacter ilicicola DSM 19980]|uniref:Alkylhydroperoxidase AhpD family core domain-containing protein n=1 Tax=Modicisalibacter ilicicola DSM 19980 TaxID=1121942 RepID=A0A1M4WB38_9GAMM|nr:carboxymuconolactone decarboxylase family protein [Halomonas ilicicola]SHE78182.1 alkylhydroperoxidase AhpD family core domain-containing protein [Halomonas ilicicola DSM 19980]